MNEIIGVAVRQGDIVIALPRPNRHCHCMAYAVDVLGLTPPIGAPALHQGFYLSDGTYLNRADALQHAKACGQEMRNPDAIAYLFSEDLW